MHNNETITTEGVYCEIAKESKAIALAEKISSEIDMKISQGSDMKPRSVKFLLERIKEEALFVALSKEGALQGSLYFKKWDNGNFISTGGMISLVSGTGKQLKKFALSHLVNKFPESSIGAVAVDKKMVAINKSLGYEEVSPEMIFHDYWDEDNQGGKIGNVRPKERIPMILNKQGSRLVKRINS